MRTDWSSKEIWLRRSFDLKEIPALMKYEGLCKGTAEIYINGCLIDTFPKGLREVDINKMGMSLKADAKNVVAVKVTNTNVEEGAYFDLGLNGAVGK